MVRASAEAMYKTKVEVMKGGVMMARAKKLAFKEGVKKMELHCDSDGGKRGKWG